MQSILSAGHSCAVYGNGTLLRQHAMAYPGTYPGIIQGGVGEPHKNKLTRPSSPVRNVQ